MSRVSPSQRLVVLFAAVTLIPSALLVVFGWRLLRQEAVIHLGALQTRRAQAADLAIAALQAELARMERTLREAPSDIAAMPPGAVFVSLRRDGLSIEPGRRVTHVPVPARLMPPPERAFDALDEAEYRRRDPVLAEKLARDLAGSANPAVRAGALVRLARIRRAMGQEAAALQAYAEAATIRGAAIGEVPADLFARWAMCGLLADLERDADLRREAQALRTDLADGRWTLTEPIYQLHMTDASAWARTAPASPTPEQQLLTAAVELLFARTQRGVAAELLPARLLLDVSGAAVTVLSATADEGVNALIATPRFVEQHWMSKVTPILQPQNLRLTLRSRGDRPDETGITYRAASESGLPWSLAVETIDPAVEDAGLRQRQWLWIAGLVTFAVLTCAGSWIVGRAVSRELAVARLQSDFVAAVSHEFRTPLTTMAQLTEMLVDGRAPDAVRQRRYYDVLARQTERLRRLVESLLDFGRMESGRSPYQRQPIDVMGWITSVVEQFQQDSASRGHQMHLAVPADRLIVDGDQDALTNALWNVLDNAAKYSPDALDVWVDVRHAGGRVAIEVRDTGIGIAAKEQRAIFGKFVRGSRARTDRIAGTGLGLSIVEHVVRAHDGTVMVRSAPDQGSTFTISLPVRSEESRQCLAS